VLDLSPLLSGSGQSVAKVLDSECSSTGALGKQLLKPTTRALEKLLGSGLKEATLIAAGGAAQLVLRLVSRRAAERGVRTGAVRRAVLVHPRLSAACVNAHLSGTDVGSDEPLACDVLFESAAARDRRLAALRHAFPIGSCRVVVGDRPALLAYSLMPYALMAAVGGEGDESDEGDEGGEGGAGDGSDADGVLQLAALPPFDGDHLDGLGQSMWLSKLSFELSRQSKQHEAIIDESEDEHAELAAKARKLEKRSTRATGAPAPAMPPAGAIAASSAAEEGNGVAAGGAATAAAIATSCGDMVDGAAGVGGAVGVSSVKAAGVATSMDGLAGVCGGVGGAPLAGSDEVGGLILRGNRCVLVRSLASPPEWHGMAVPTTTRRADESPLAAATRAVSELCDIDGSTEVVPLSAVPPASLYRPGGARVDVYVMYAARGPPGDLEDADESDDEDLYDWYTWPRALHALAHDAPSVAMLRTVAFALAAAAAAAAVPSKWGGVFGQEWTSNPQAAPTPAASALPAPPPHAGATRPVAAADAAVVAAAASAALEAAAAAAAAARAAADAAAKLGHPVAASTLLLAPPIDAAISARPPSSSSVVTSMASTEPLTWHSTRPFHPGRLHAAVAQPEGILRSVRVEGICWLASRYDEQAIWSARGGRVRLRRGPPWWAALPSSEWPNGLYDDLCDSGFWHEPHGDRQSELRIELLGHVADDARAVARARVAAALDACVLSDGEFADGADGWDAYEDPFLEAERHAPFSFVPAQPSVGEAQAAGGAQMATVSCEPCA
jgi:ADP-ribose pyrophosphatase YjhB (NUDIX family)